MAVVEIHVEVLPPAFVRGDDDEISVRNITFASPTTLGRISYQFHYKPQAILIKLLNRSLVVIK